MVSLHMLLYGVFFLYFFDKVTLLENGLARTPPMGWMSWGYYMCATDCKKHPEKCLNEKLILSVADAFYTEGYLEAGYEYIVIDDCWSERERDSNGRLVPDHKRFPKGMRFLADYIHARDMKFGMYTNIAEDTCMRYPGSKGHFKEDAMQFAEWGVDYIKVDGCFVTEAHLNRAYIELGNYLNMTGRPMVYSCSWPYYAQYIHNKTPDYTKIEPLCNMWRNYHDVAPHWGNVRYIIDHYTKNYETYAPHHGPGHWNDPDMLMFGTKALTRNQARIQLAVFAMLSAPLLLSCNMTMVTEYERSLLLNLELLAVAQDPLGIMAKPYKLNDLLTLWVKRHLPMKGDMYHSFSFLFVNFGIVAQYISIAPKEYGLNSTMPYTVMDIFTRTFILNITLEDTLEALVPPEDVLMYTLFPL